MSMNFPWYFLLVFAAAELWPAFVLVGLVLFGIGLVVRRRGARITLITLASVLLALPSVALVVLVDTKINDALEKHSDALYDASLQETLAAPRHVLDATLPTGSVVQWSDKARVMFSSVTLAAPTTVFGLPLTGAIGQGYEQQWNVTLAADHTVDGFPCAAGNIAFTPDLVLAACTLATPLTVHGLTLPARTEVSVLTGYNVDTFTVPDGAFVSLPDSGGAVATTGAQIKLDETGLIDEVELPDGGTLSVLGLPLARHVAWHYPGTDDDTKPSHPVPPADRISGDAGPGLRCNGQFLNDHPFVAISLTGKTITISQPDGSKRPPLPVSACSVVPMPREQQSQGGH